MKRQIVSNLAMLKAIYNRTDSFMTQIIEVPFIKMHGIGNDYIYINDLEGKKLFYLEEKFLPDLTSKISDRHFGFGSDGLILILPSDKADFRMRIFNSDGSEAKMCGNGIRCVGKYVYDLKFTNKEIITVETNSGIKTLELKTEKGEVKRVEVEMGTPMFKKGEIPAFGNSDAEMNDEELSIEGGTYTVTGVSMGNPHGVIIVDEVEHLDLEKIGPELEKHSIWPDRANIEFVKILNPHEIEVRVWERGSGETLACGTGACASSVVAIRKRLCQQEVTVHLRGGDLKVSYDEKENKVRMEGPASFVGSGRFLFHYNK